MNKDKNYIFQSKTDIIDPLRVVFLCGVKFRKNEKDKRMILKKYIESLNKEHLKVIVLEEHFQFRNTTANYLSYDDIFMKNLRDIELMTSLYSDKIIIIHESLSTAAEIGLFASNETNHEKICLLIPDFYSIEEDKLSGFLKLAFFKKNTNITNITFYPKTELNVISDNKSDYHTYFRNNKIGTILGKNIVHFIDSKAIEKRTISFIKGHYGKLSTGLNDISYVCSDEKGSIHIGLSSTIIRLHIISFFNLNSFKKFFREAKSINKVVSAVESIYKYILKLTVSELDGKDYIAYSIKITVKDTDLDFRKTIAYFLYLLQAMEFISLPVDTLNSNAKIHNIFETTYKNYESLLKELSLSTISL